MDSYDKTPIDIFGKTVLAKFGYEEGKAIGKNNNGKIPAPIEYIARPHKLGLGAKPSELQLKKHKDYKDFEKPVDGGKNYKSINESLKEKEKL